MPGGGSLCVISRGSSDRSLRLAHLAFNGHMSGALLAVASV